MTGTVLDGAGRACQDPPSDLRVSMAEQDRVDPQGRYPVPLGWWIGTTKPVLATAALVDDVNMTLVTGFTDSGKDNFVLSWLYSLGYRYTPRDIQFALICGKGGLSLNGWHTKQHTWLFARGKQDIQPAMEALVKERERRTKILWDSKCEKWEEYAGSDLPLLVVYVSELMLLQSIVGKTELADWLNEELTSCRAMGIRYIIGTQNATKLDTRWRSQVSLHVAGYQQSQDGDEPNTGVSSSVLRKLGTRADGVIVGVPPSELPIPPGGAGVFTLVQGRTVLTVRAPFLNKEQRQWWLNQLPDDPAKVAAENRAQRQVDVNANPQQVDATTNPLLVALMTGQPLPIGDMPEQPVSQPKAPAIQLSELIKRKTLGELEKDPMFIDACIQSYQRSGQVRPTTAEVFESAPGAKDGWTGSRQTIVTKALRTAGVLMVDSPSPAVQAA
jgi:DNA segregation ATPase FtsK/SpoIIIE, S-DNA-T family